MAAGGEQDGGAPLRPDDDAAGERSVWSRPVPAADGWPGADQPGDPAPVDAHTWRPPVPASTAPERADDVLAPAAVPAGPEVVSTGRQGPLARVHGAGGSSPGRPAAPAVTGWGDPEPAAWGTPPPAAPPPPAASGAGPPGGPPRRPLLPPPDQGPKPPTRSEWGRRLARLGPLARSRQTPTLGPALAGAGGIVVTAAGLWLAEYSHARTGSVTRAMVIWAGMLVVGLAFTALRIPASSAGSVMSGVAAPALLYYLFLGQDWTSVRLGGALLVLVLLLLYTVGPWRGRTFHLTLLVVAGWAFAVSLAPFPMAPAPDGAPELPFTHFTVAQSLGLAGAACLLVGIGYLAFGSWLHYQDLSGMATPFLAVACLALPLGALLLLQAREAAEAAALAAIGFVVAIVGSTARRRGLTWGGAGAFALGVLALARTVVDREVTLALAAVAIGAGLVVLAVLVGAPAEDVP